MTGSQDSRQRSLVVVLLPQIILLFLFLTMYGLSLLQIIPSPHELNELLVSLFKRFGLPIIGLSSFIENLIGVNSYFPGAFTILTGMSLTAGHPKEALVTYLVIYIPAYLANILSFFLGKLRSSDKQPGSSSPRKTTLWFICTYWHPQLAAVSAFSVGVRDLLPPKEFLIRSFLVSLVWSVFWAVVIYNSGLMVNVTGYFSMLFFVYVVVWMVFDTWRFFKTKAVARL